MNEEKNINIFKKTKIYLNEKNRKVKDSINKDIGKKTYQVLNILVITIFIVIIPILFTTLTMFLNTSNNPEGVISLLTYHIIFYMTWVILLLLVMARSFFKEYK